MITDDQFEMEKKGLEVMKQRSLADFVFTTNNNNALSIEKSDRRFSIFHCSTELVGQYDHWNKFYELLEDEATLYGLFQYFKQFQLTIHNFQSCRPICQLYRELQQANTKSEILFLIDICNDSASPPTRLAVNIENVHTTLQAENIDDQFRVKSSILYDTYKKWIADRGFDYKINITRFGLNMKMLTDDKPEGVRGFGFKKISGMVYYTFDLEKLSNHLTEHGYM